MTREEMIIEYYSNGKIPFLIKLYDYIKGRLDKYEYKHNRKLGRDWINTIYDNSNNNIRIDIMYKMDGNRKMTKVIIIQAIILIGYLASYGIIKIIEEITIDSEKEKEKKNE